MDFRFCCGNNLLYARAGANPKLACEILGVKPGAKLAKADVKRAYRVGIVANHPDSRES